MPDQPSNSVTTKVIYCNRCLGETRHIRRGEHVHHEELDDGHTWEQIAYTLWTCAGCDMGTMETGFTASYLEDEDYSYDPPRAASDIKPKVFRRIPQKLRRIYSQTVKAFNLNLSVLCAAGLRSIIEGICADKGVKGKNLESKIDALESYLPKSIVANLHSFRFMGNDALHELTAPKREELKVAIEVSEDLLNIMYDLDYKASLLPKKPSKGRSASAG